MPNTHAHTPIDAGVSIEPLNDGQRRCTALARRTGTRCRRAPIIGGSVCSKHGGSAGQVKRAAQRRVAEAGAAALVASQDIEPTADPALALLRVCGEMEALSKALRGRVADLNNLSTTDRTGAMDLLPEIQAYERSLDRLARTLVSVNRLGLDARKIDIEQARLQLVATAVRNAVYSPLANLTWDQADRVLTAIVVEFDRLPVAP